VDVCAIAQLVVNRKPGTCPAYIMTEQQLEILRGEVSSASKCTEDSSNVGAVVGGVIGGIVGILVLFFVFKRVRASCLTREADSKRLTAQTRQKQAETRVCVVCGCVCVSVVCVCVRERERKKEREKRVSYSCMYVLGRHRRRALQPKMLLSDSNLKCKRQIHL